MLMKRISSGYPSTPLKITFPAVRKITKCLCIIINSRNPFFHLKLVTRLMLSLEDELMVLNLVRLCRRFAGLKRIPRNVLLRIVMGRLLSRWCCKWETYLLIHSFFSPLSCFYYLYLFTHFSSICTHCK